MKRRTWRLTDRGWWVLASVSVLGVIAVDGLVGGLAGWVR